MGEQGRAAQREPDVGGADHLTGERAESGAHLGAEEQAAHLAHHPVERAGQVTEHLRQVHALGQGHAFRQRHAGRQLQVGQVEAAEATELRKAATHPAAEGLHDLVGHRVADALPHRDGALDPFGTAPAGQLLSSAGQRGEGRRLVQPEVGELTGFANLLLLAAVGGAALGGCGLRRDLAGQIPVDGAALPGQQLLQLAEHAVAEAAEPPSPPKPKPPDPPEPLSPESPEPGVNPKGFWPLITVTVVRVTGLRLGRGW